VTGTPVYGIQQGSYEQIGRQVTARFYVTTTAITGISGNIAIGGLPFANNSSETGFCALSFFAGWTAPANFAYMGAILDPSVNFVRLIASGFAGGALSSVTNAQLAAATNFAGVISYHV
jgi:hypothetical protein